MRQTGSSTVYDIGVPPPDNFTYVLPVDEMEHVPEKPFCWDSTCMCHEDEIEIGIVAQHVAQGLFTPEEATDFVGGKGISDKTKSKSSGQSAKFRPQCRTAWRRPAVYVR